MKEELDGDGVSADYIDLVRQTDIALIEITNNFIDETRPVHVV